VKGHVILLLILLLITIINVNSEVIGNKQILNITYSDKIPTGRMNIKHWEGSTNNENCYFEYEFIREWTLHEPTSYIGTIKSKTTTTTTTTTTLYKDGVAIRDSMISETVMS